MPVITVSRQEGSGGDELSASLAHILGYRLVDKELLARAAALAHVPPERMEEFEGRSVSPLSRFLHGVARGLPGLDEYYRSFANLADQGEHLRHYLYYGHKEGDADVGRLTADDCRRYFETAIRDLAQRGNVILVGRGSQVLLADFPHTLHLRLIASERARAQDVMRRRGWDEKAALAYLHDQDRHRADYLKINYGRSADEPALYDLTLRMDHLSADAIVEFVRRWAIEETLKHKQELSRAD